MQVTIEVPPEIEAGLMAQAKEQGLPLPQYVMHLLREQVPVRAGYDLSPEEWVTRFEAWVGSHSENTVVLPDAAMERESIYGDHGQ